MSFRYLIFVELGFVVLASWGVALLVLRALRRTRDSALEQVAALKVRLRAQRDELARTREELAQTKLALAAASMAQLAPEDEEDLGALIIDLDESMAMDAEHLAALGGLQVDMEAGIGRLDGLQTPVDIAAPEIEEMRRELALLREQSGRSGRVISELTKALEYSRGKVREIEKGSRRRYGAQLDKTRDEAENTIRRLTRDNRTLQTRLSRELATHQEAIERITSMLRESDDKYRALVAASKAEKFSMAAAIDHLREQLAASADKKMTEDQTQDLLARLREMDEALARSAREREFLDARFVELEEALEQAEVVYEELNRTKVEYRMLEERFLQLEKDEGRNTIPSAETAPAWQPLPTTPETIAFDNTVLDGLARAAESKSSDY